ncbi:uncharacterized protein [Panulirus ornatus]|uniref:uncharacterized protein n=1 Tax=Panulirus ornatus TaxID=150431 RepID=UPI003A8BBCB8
MVNNREVRRGGKKMVGGRRSGASLVLLAWASLLLGLARATVIPGVDPACGSLGPGECKVRDSRCKVVRQLAQGKAGPVKDVFDCAAAQGVPKMQVINVLSTAFKSGQPETIVDRVISNDTQAASQLRRCVYTAGGLVTVNGTLDRAAMVQKLQSLPYTHPAVLDTIALAVAECPEPENLQMSSFLSCVRSSCIQDMPAKVAALPVFFQDDEDDDDKKCKRGKKGKKCKKH